MTRTFREQLKGCRNCIAPWTQIHGYVLTLDLSTAPIDSHGTCDICWSHEWKCSWDKEGLAEACNVTWHGTPAFAAFRLASKSRMLWLQIFSVTRYCAIACISTAPEAALDQKSVPMSKMTMPSTVAP